MRCPHCANDNPAGAKFCSGCGAALDLVCPGCNYSNRTGSRFCNACGHRFSADVAGPAAIGSVPRSADASPPDQAWRAPRASQDAERRQLTVMFCDLVGSTELSTRVDPEELRDVLGAYQSATASVIRRFDGHIAQYLGDGVLAYFGYPQAHEDDAARAIRAAMEIVSTVGTLSSQPERERAEPLAVRVAVHTGPVVVGDVGDGSRHEQLALGEIPNIAARLQGLAQPNTVVISGATRRLVQNLVTCRDLGFQTIKSVAAPVHVYEVLGVSPSWNRLAMVGPTGLTPLVGREQEVALLLERWEQ